MSHTNLFIITTYQYASAEYGTSVPKAPLRFGVRGALNLRGNPDSPDAPYTVSISTPNKSGETHFPFSKLN